MMGSGFDPAAGAGSGEEGLACFMEADIGRPLEYGLELFLGGNGNTGRVICVLNEKGTLRYSGILKEVNGLRFLPPR